MRDLIRDILEKEVVTSQEAADLLDIESSGIRHKAAKGKIESVLKGGVSLFDIQDIKQLANE